MWNLLYDSTKEYFSWNRIFIILDRIKFLKRLATYVIYKQNKISSNIINNLDKENDLIL